MDAVTIATGIVNFICHELYAASQMVRLYRITELVRFFRTLLDFSECLTV